MPTATLPAAPRPLTQPWRNAIAVGRAYELLRSDLCQHLAWAQREIGFKAIRFHAVFHDEMGVVRRRPDGRLAFSWTLVDQVYDRCLALGLKPFIELNPMPTALASGEQVMFWYRMNVTPPKLWEEWQELVRAFAAHLIERYGRDEVRGWHFEVWNEPNLGAFWGGNREQYFQLYDHAARAVKSVDAQLRIGGPATSKANWIPEMIAHCHQHGVPLDFVTTHLYPQDEYVDHPDRVGSPHAPGRFFVNTVRRVQREVRASPMPHLPIHWTEWNSMSTRPGSKIDWCDNATNDSLHGAAHVCAVLADLDDAADTLCWWTVSDVFEEGSMPHAPFTGTYGLVTIHGIPKAHGNGLRMLRQLAGGDRLDITLEADAPQGTGALAVHDGAIARSLLWNYQIPGYENRTAWTGTLDLPAPGADGARRIVCSRIRPGAGSPYETWVAMGMPHQLAPSEEALLRAHGEPEASFLIVDAAGGRVHIPFTLQPGEVLLCEVRPMGDARQPRGAKSSDMALWNAGMGMKSV